MKQNYFLFLLVVFILAFPLAAEKVNPSEAEQVVLTHLAGQQMTWDVQANEGLYHHGNALTGYTVKSVNPVMDEENGDTLFHVFHLSPEGFIVVSPDTAIQPIIAYSYYGAFPMENTPGNTLLQMLKSDMKLRRASIPATKERYITVNNRKWAVLLNNPPEIQTVEQWPPVEHSQYNKGWLPVETLPFETTTMANIDNYWQLVTSFSFPARYGDNYSPELPMDAAEALGKKLSFDSARELLESSSPLFFDILTENMRKGWPAQLEVQLDKHQGQFFVISDGFRLTAVGDSYYHLDFGWQTGIPGIWYALPQWMPLGYNIVNAAAVNIHPIHDLYEPNNTLPEAYPIIDTDFKGSRGIWQIVSHTSIKPGNEKDWYRFEANEGDELSISSQALSSDLMDVTLYKGVELMKKGTIGSEGNDIQLSYKVESPGTYFVSVALMANASNEEVLDYGLQIERFRITSEEQKLPPKTLLGIYISGPSSVDENSSAIYTATAYYDDESSTNVSNYATWTSSNINLAEMEGNHLYSIPVLSNQTVTITATYSSKSANKNVTIVNVALDHISVSGATGLMENTSTSYTATAHFTNGATSNVTSSATWSENSSYASMSGNTLSASTVSSNQGVRVTATYSNGGITKSSYVDAVIVNFALNYIMMSGPGIVYENSSAWYYVNAYFTDGSVHDVTFSTFFTETFMNAWMGGSVLYTNSVSQNEYGGIWAHYTYNGVTKSDYRSVTIYNY
jgi:Spi protease inhibitor/Bacterial pre-peptidase C-terminal domain